MKKLKKYLILNFIIAWVLQLCAIIAFAAQDNLLYQASLMIMMYAPFISVFFCNKSMAGFGWKPNLLGKAKYFFIAWLLPGVCAILGALIFYGLFRGAFDNTGKYLISQMGEDALVQLEASGLTINSYNAVTILAAFTYAPVLNSFLAVGEEVGWRGFMYPILKQEYGTLKGRIIGGAIWGVWHWPVMTIGYEYGIDYPGFPFIGPFIFCIYAICAGIILDWIYEKTQIIWMPALCHGAINAATFGLLWMNPEYSNLLILGPVPIGIISMIPMMAVAILISTKQKSEK